VLVLRVSVLHPFRCELTVGGLMLFFQQGVVRWKWLSPLGDVDSLAQICSGPVLRSRCHRTTGATTCPLWNDLVTD
jgi:hypothetical protein